MASDEANSDTTIPPGQEEYGFIGFLGNGDGSAPNGNLVLDSSGNAFGTTKAGGTNNNPTIFESPNSNGTPNGPDVLTSFSNYTGTTGSALAPGNLVIDSSGNLFGTTAAGGATKRSHGTVFELAKNASSPTGYAANPTMLVSFKNAKGTGPENLTTDSAGDLLGTTTTGRGGVNGGTVFEVNKTARGYAGREHVLANFRGKEHITSNLLVTSSGIYGSVAGGRAGAGQIFELKKTRFGTFRHKPTTISAVPGVTNLAADGSGNVFAVSSTGGSAHDGLISELGPKGSTSVVGNFYGPNGANPTGISIDGAGNIYGSTSAGGTSGYGTIFKISKTSSGYVQNNPVSLTGPNGVHPGSNPVGSPTVNGNVLDVTTNGGTTGNGNISYFTTDTPPLNPTFAAGTANNAVEAPAAAAAAVCFAEGTRLRTSAGEVSVEALAVGDLVVTASGESRPVKWLGHRTLDCRRHPRPHEVLPIRIAAHAFAPGKPARDLYVSPGHAICVDVMGEALMPAASLVNGTTITQVEVARVTYWHVELGSHDIVLAEGVASESYLEMGNRRFFNEAGVVTLAPSPDIAPARTHADFCRPFHATGPLVDVVRAALAARAEAIGASRAMAEERLAS